LPIIELQTQTVMLPIYYRVEKSMVLKTNINTGFPAKFYSNWGLYYI